MPKQYPRELQERAVRLVAEHRGEYETEYAAIRSIAAKLGIATPETLRQWIRKADVDGPWKTLAEVGLATAEYVEWFNLARLRSAIGHVPPAQHEAAHYAQTQPQPAAAGANT